MVKVNPNSRFFVVVRPDAQGDVVGRFDIAGDIDVDVGFDGDNLDSDIKIIELSDRASLGDYPLSKKESWFIDE